VEKSVYEVHAAFPLINEASAYVIVTWARSSLNLWALSLEVKGYRR